MNALAEGVHYGIDMQRYVADPCPEPSLSKGTIQRLFADAPVHAWFRHPRLNPDYRDSNSSRADIGSAVHDSILCDDRVIYGDFPDFRTKAAKEWRDGIYGDGRIPILQKVKDSILAATASARAMLETLPGWSDDYKHEGTMIWKDGPTWKRGRFDIWHSDCNTIIDIKTCLSANPDQWIRRTLSSGGYDIQAEHYLDGLRKVGLGNETTEFLFLLVEIEPPYCCSFVGLGPEFSEAARRKIKIATKRWSSCMEKDEWPGYGKFPHWAEFPGWEEQQIANQELLERGICQK